MRNLFSFYFDSFWTALKLSWKWAAGIATGLGILIPLLRELAKPKPELEVAMTSLLWQIPVAIFAIFLYIVVFIYTPYWKYKKLEKKAENREEELKEEARIRETKLKVEIEGKEQELQVVKNELEAEKTKNATPEIKVSIKEAYIIPSAVGADCFVRLVVYNKSAPMRVMDYQMKLITEEGEYIGRRADVSGYLWVDRSGGELDQDGDPQWIDIRKETLSSIPINALVTRTDPLTGWLRFCFEGVPEWKTWWEVVGLGYETDEYGEEHQCPVSDVFFVKTTATGITVTVIDSDGNQIEAHSKQVSCDASRIIKPLRQNGGKR